MFWFKKQLKVKMRESVDPQVVVLDFESDILREDQHVYLKGSLRGHEGSGAFGAQLRDFLGEALFPVEELFFAKQNMTVRFGKSPATGLAPSKEQKVSLAKKLVEILRTKEVAKEIPFQVGELKSLEGGGAKAADPLAGVSQVVNRQGSEGAGQGPGTEAAGDPKKTSIIEKKIQVILEKSINPKLDSHGGWAKLIKFDEGTLHLELGGGCQGCGQAQQTLKLGIEKAIKEMVPEVKNVVDVTDHASGENPYY